MPSKKKSDKCAVCGAIAEQRCAGCLSIYYCSRDHQKQHWKTHKTACKPIKICENSTLGRYLVAKRAIKQGEVILREKPLVEGPAQLSGPVCLGCNRGFLNESECKPCDKCGWPVCNDECANLDVHKAECEFTIKRGQKISIKDFIVPHPNYQYVTLIRCLYLRDNYPEKWEKLMKLESHDKSRKSSTEAYEQDRNSAEFCRKFFKLENSFSVEEILKIMGIIQINSHEVPLTVPTYIAIFEMCSMLEHNCRANCYKSFTSSGEILIAAGTDIKEGEHLSISYIDPLWGTANRRHYLLCTKFFHCQCERCRDPTEFGTMYNAIKCQESDCEGSLLPKTFICDDENETPESSDKNKWYCNKCSGTQTASAVQKLLDHIGKDLAAMKKDDIACCQKFLDFYGKLLHRNHFYMTDVRIALAQLIGQKTKAGLADVPEEQLSEKARLCKKIVDLLEIITPAEVRLRGTILFELHAAIAEIGRRQASKGECGPEALEAMLLESKKILTQAVALLKHEPEALPEGKIKLQAKHILTELENLICTLHQNVGDMP